MCLVALDMHGDVDVLEQIRQTFDRVTHHGAANVVRVGVRDEHPRKPHSVPGEQVEKTGDVIRRVDHDGLARVAVADQVAEVHHLASERVLAPEIATREELAEVEPRIPVVSRGVALVLHVGHGPTETIGKKMGPAENRSGACGVLWLSKETK